MPEAEAELVEGWWTEYGGIRWGLMFAVEMMRAYAACILFALFFLGGWQVPFEDSLVALPYIGGGLETVFTATPGLFILLAKAYIMFAFFVWGFFNLDTNTNKLSKMLRFWDPKPGADSYWLIKCVGNSSAKCFKTNDSDTQLYELTTASGFDTA